VARASKRRARTGLPDPHLSNLVKVAFASGTKDLNPQLVDRLAEIYPELPLYVVSEFAPRRGEWIPYHPYRSWRENLDACRAALEGKTIRLAAVLLVPRMPYRRLRLMALVLSVRGFLAYNENLDSFMLRPRSLPGILRHLAWRVANFVRWHLRAENPWRLNPRLRWQALVAEWAGWLLQLRRTRRQRPMTYHELDAGISVVVSTRKGREPLNAILSALRTEGADEIIEADESVDRWIARVRYSHVLLLNTGVLVRPDLLADLRQAFQRVPDLFCATAQITFPPAQVAGKRDPIPGENLSYVLYGSGRCSLFDTSKLRELGGLNTIYEPTCLEDLDLGWRAWLRGWPSVFVAGAQMQHEHQATAMVEGNYLKFAAATGSRTIWDEAIHRFEVRGGPLDGAWRIPLSVPLHGTVDPQVLALTNGDVAVFPGLAARNLPVVLVATPYLPFPLAHGGAVRIFSLMSRAAPDFDQAMVAFCDRLEEPPRELLDLCVELVLVKRKGTHYRKSSARPDMVDEMDSPAFHGALKQMVKKWRPAVAQLEFTPMAQYAADCRPAMTVLVEHDITFDLHEQLVRTDPGWEARQQLEKWRSFERATWPHMDRVVTMSLKDRDAVGLPSALCLPNGVDLQRFRPVPGRAEPGRVLFIGSFTHLPNLLALEFFLQSVWPQLDDLQPVLHVIAGARHEYYVDFYRKRIEAPRLELEGFVSDVRKAYERASVVIAPLTASAGTNIKILEAMAMGKAIVSTPAGINGLDVSDGVLVAADAREFARSLRRCLEDATERERLGRKGRSIVERDYGWDEIGKKQKAMYDELIGHACASHAPGR
jgi:glycosyltransferase involved in cell wall biosynthesis